METLERVFLGHQDTLVMGQGAQAALIEFTGSAVLVDHLLGEIHHVGHVEFGIGQGGGGEVPVGDQFRALRAQGKEPYRPHVVDMPDHVDRRQADDEGL